MRAPIRVLVVDDSLVMRSLLRMVLASEPSIELVGMAADGVAALAIIDRLKPDLILLDIEMPRMNGLEVLAALKTRPRKAKIIMCSTLTCRGAGITLEALAQGASDYVTKPTAQHGAADAVATLARELVPKILALCPAQEKSAEHVDTAHAASARAHEPLSAKQVRVVVMGVSTGGPVALEALLPRLPADFPVPILIVQHMPRLFTSLLADRLNRECGLTVVEASSGIRPEPGTVYIARGDWHMELIRQAFKDGYALRLTQSAPDYCRPSVDVLFQSAAEVCGDGVLAVVLTGMGSDGLEGCRAIRNAGGHILIQDRATSSVWGMPGVVSAAGLAHRTLPLPAIAAELQRLCPTPHSIFAARG